MIRGMAAAVFQCRSDRRPAQNAFSARGDRRREVKDFFPELAAYCARSPKAWEDQLRKMAPGGRGVRIDCTTGRLYKP
jgi:hypothetical protein